MSNKHRLRLIETPSPSRLETCLDMFLLHQEASRHTSRTIGTYRETLAPFLEFLANDNLTIPEDISPDASWRRRYT